MILSRAIFILSITLFSCGGIDCYDCTHLDTAFESYTICESDFNSKSDLEMAVATAEADIGYECERK